MQSENEESFKYFAEKNYNFIFYFSCLLYICIQNIILDLHFF